MLCFLLFLLSPISTLHNHTTCHKSTQQSKLFHVFTSSFSYHFLWAAYPPHASFWQLICTMYQTENHIILPHWISYQVKGTGNAPRNILYYLFPSWFLGNNSLWVGLEEAANPDKKKSSLNSFICVPSSMEKLPSHTSSYFIISHLLVSL